jgi:hypothetical protein
MDAKPVSGDCWFVDGFSLSPPRGILAFAVRRTHGIIIGNRALVVR